VALFRRRPERVEALIVGLGNPGPQYEGTRHNIGFAVVNELARRHHFVQAKRGFDGRYAAGVMAGHAAGMLTPATFMNRSGKSVAAALRGLELGLDRLLVVHDHIDLPFGQLRLSVGGGSGGHNGLKSITGLVGADYHRLRVGVGRPPSRDPDVVADYVLQRFADSRAEVERVVREAADAVELWLCDGAENAMNGVNPA
jgi:PTH1 family peptidyl-tRNA hydrolase